MRERRLRGAFPSQATRRQMEVLAAFVAAGGSVQNAAELVGIRPSTVKRHLADAEYLSKRDATRADLAELPDGDRIRAFDAYRARVLALPDAIEAASPARREELCRIVVQRVVVRDRQLEMIDWTPAARPFFERQRECPQGDSNP